MSDLAAFLAARLDEDEARARAADVKQGDPDWWPSARQGDRIIGIHGSATVRSRRDNRPIARVQSCGDEDGPAAITDGDAVAAHIARHGPARVLREVAAGRAILAVVQAIPHSYVEDCYYSCELAVDPGDPEQRAGSGYCNDNAVRTGGCTCGRDVLAARLLGPLAAVYSDHPDYDPAQAPG